MTSAAWVAQLATPNRTWVNVQGWCRTHNYRPSTEELTAMLEGSPRICSGVIQEQRFHQAVHVNSCKLSVLAPTNKGYCQPSLLGKKPMVLHKIAYMAVHGPPVAGLEISHLCHNSTCCKIEHLFAEPGLLNNARKGCAVWVYCPHQHPNNRQCIVWVCGHGSAAGNLPYCIRNHPAGVYVDDMVGLKTVAHGWCCG